MTTLKAAHGKDYRVAPCRAGRQAAHFWKYWIAGNEAYASNRILGHLSKISIHRSGQIHFRIGEKRQVLARPSPIGAWLHAFELRFLLGPNASFPRNENLKNKKGVLIEVPQDTVLILNLLIAGSERQNPIELPQVFQSAAEMLWHGILRNQQSVVLIGRVLDMDDENRNALRYIREELRPTPIMTGQLRSPPHTEIKHVFWSPSGGNVILVIPMGSEDYRTQGAPSQT